MDKNISTVITAYNKQDTIAKTLESLISQPAGFKEIIVVDDGSTDNSAKIVKEFTAKQKNIKYVFQENHGVSAAANTGIKMASGDFVAVFDGDITLDRNWLSGLMPYFDDNRVAAAAGLTKTMNPENLWAALAGYNVEYRQSKIKDESVDHLSTTNTIYRKSVLDRVGLFNPDFRYGQDNELSYRIVNAGYKLILSQRTFCLHFWPESFTAYFKQRMHGAIGRMMLVKKYPKRLAGDKVSSLKYFLEMPFGLLFLLSLSASLLSPDFLIFSMIIFILIFVFQFDEIRFFVKNRKALTGIFMPFFTALRAIAWMSGIIKFYAA